MGFQAKKEPLNIYYTLLGRKKTNSVENVFKDFSFHDSSIINFANNAVLSFAATIEVPSGCSGSIWAIKLDGEF